MKKKDTPAIQIIAPSTSIHVTFCLKKIIAGGIIRTGTIDIMVDAIPALV